jgi:putative ABC transport system permease protein
MLSSLLEGFRSALAAIRAHALRSFLTTLGIIIGVTAVIAVVSLIQGFSSSITSRFKGLGTNSIVIYAHIPRKQRLAGKTAKITLDDLTAIRHDVAGIKNITPELILAQFGGGIQYKNNSSTTSIQGMTADFAESGVYYPVVGRFITPSDNRSHRRIAVIGQTVRENLSLPRNPSGQFVKMFDEWFKIVGVLNKRGQIFGHDQDNLVMIPFETARSIAGAAEVPNIVIQLTVNNVKQIKTITGRITQILRRQHKLKPGQENDFKVQTAAELTSTINSIFDSITAVLGGIVGISLLVGGIGIMNIMLVSVTERTREIGICKSLGAKRRDILLQFLIEAVVLSLLGGLIGLGLGYGIGLLAAHLLPSFSSAHVPWWAILLALGFSAGTGIVFGIAPAAKAAALDPIEALRYE